MLFLLWCPVTANPLFQITWFINCFWAVGHPHATGVQLFPSSMFYDPFYMSIQSQNFIHCTLHNILFHVRLISHMIPSIQFPPEIHSSVSKTISQESDKRSSILDGWRDLYPRYPLGPIQPPPVGTIGYFLRDKGAGKWSWPLTSI